MKLGFPVKENRGLESQMAEDLSRADYLLVYDTKNLDYEVHTEENIIKRHQESTYLKAMKKSGIEGLFFKQIYPLAFRALTTNEFTLYRAESDTILENISEFLNGEIPNITEEDFIASSCSGTCSSCDSTSCN